MTDQASYPLLQKVYSLIRRLSDIIERLSQKVETIAGHAPEVTVTILYVIFHFVIAYFHEPWFDEAVAWQIAKCASVRDILFTLPHYEGHPPLWDLVLLPFARLGCPYELSLSIVNILFAGAAVILIIWKSPFPRVIRLLLPFTYFFFYQYGVIARPYSMMMLAFILTAITFGERDTKPWKHILSLMLLCFTSAYGILFAGGITIAWLVGLLKQEGFRFLLDRKRTLALFCLLIFAIVLIVEIFPASDTYAIKYTEIYPESNHLLTRLLYTFLVMPADSVVTNVYSDYCLLSSAHLYNYRTSAGIIIGIFIWIVSLRFTRKRGTLLTCIIPYSLFAVFAAAKYISPHHMGITLLFAVFCAWSSCSRTSTADKEEGRFGGYILRYLTLIVAAISMGVSLYWSISSSVQDVMYAYDASRDVAQYISENNLEDYDILTGFAIFYELDEDGIATENVLAYDFNQFYACDNVLAYFDRNIFFNVNDGRDDMAYTFHKFSDLEENTERIAKWREQGPPDFILSNRYDYDIIYEGIADASDYVLVYCSDYGRIWKGESLTHMAMIYAHREIMEELGLNRAFE